MVQEICRCAAHSWDLKGKAGDGRAQRHTAGQGSGTSVCGLWLGPNLHLEEQGTQHGLGRHVGFMHGRMQATLMVPWQPLSNKVVPWQLPWSTINSVTEGYCTALPMSSA